MDADDLSLQNVATVKLPRCEASVSAVAGHDCPGPCARLWPDTRRGAALVRYVSAIGLK